MVSLIEKEIAGNSEPMTACEVAIADFTNDDTVNIYDLVALMDFLAAGR